MKRRVLHHSLLAAAMLLAALPGRAETVNLQLAVEMSLAADPRIKEREQVVEAARSLLREVQGNAGWRISANAFIGLAPEVEGGFYEGGAFSGTTPRTDGDEINGISEWTHLDFALIKPLYTFGKVERYGEAAQGNIDLKLGELKQTRGDTIYDTKRAYYGHLTAHEIRIFLEDIQDKLNRSIASVERNLNEETGESKQSDLYALQAAKGLLGKYTHQARALEKISLDGLKVLTGVGLKGDLAVADERIEPRKTRCKEHWRARRCRDRGCSSCRSIPPSGSDPLPAKSSRYATCRKCTQARCQRQPL